VGGEEENGVIEKKEGKKRLERKKTDSRRTTLQVSRKKEIRQFLGCALRNSKKASLSEKGGGGGKKGFSNTLPRET